ncbi:transcription repressor NadR [Filibacter tadaridae]|uniref:Transcription repressor NadR n=2 Tax=Filibacter tadaridae TaxID=2483811 RepID=A0A3P5X118_9BACL|nr:Transcription repressor NadR [Filibacter tadaridae]
MTENEKVLGEERRQLLIATLKKATKALPGRELGELTNVSRQVIVSDITLLKARNEPIIATSQGYVYMHPQAVPERYEKTIVCRHTPGQAEEELNIFVDNGVTVKDVRIEHPVYGDLSASIMVSNRSDVKEFIHKVSEVNGVFLLKLTDGGIHLHTVIADNEQQIQNAEDALRKADILVD